MKDFCQQVEALGLHGKIPAQTKLTLDGEGLGLHWLAGMQDKLTKKKKSCSVKAKAKVKVVKHTVGLIVQHMKGLLVQHMKEFKQSLTMNDLKETDKEKLKAERENNDRLSTC